MKRKQLENEIGNFHSLRDLKSEIKSMEECLKDLKDIELAWQLAKSEGLNISNDVREFVVYDKGQLTRLFKEQNKMMFSHALKLKEFLNKIVKSNGNIF